jgi:serine/threonine protein kinase
MSVDVGTRLGSLEVTALLGKGGMGEVYRARDLMMQREFGIKILLDEFSGDANRRKDILDAYGSNTKKNNESQSPHRGGHSPCKMTRLPGESSYRLP